MTIFLDWLLQNFVFLDVGVNSAPAGWTSCVAYRADPWVDVVLKMDQSVLENGNGS